MPAKQSPGPGATLFGSNFPSIPDLAVGQRRFFSCVRACDMRKHYLVGLAILAVGAAVGLFTGGMIGLAVAASCLVLGLLYLMESEARRTRSVGAQATRPAHQKTEVLFLIKEIHVRPQVGGKFRELAGQELVRFDFEIFLYCWLVNQTELPLRIAEGPQLTVRRPSVPLVNAARVVGDLDRWRLGKLSQQLDSTDLLVLRAAQETITEFDTLGSLECGVPHKGWLHFRVQMTAEEFKASTLELSITDSLSNYHVSTTSGPRYMPGRIWPYVPSAEPSLPKTDPYPGAPLPTGT
jgi:hypothetical protein